MYDQPMAFRVSAKDRKRFQKWCRANKLVPSAVLRRWVQAVHTDTALQVMAR